MTESLITKKAISQALVDLCAHKRFDKISIADITNKCGLKRQTFYYHFTDKYDLLEWIYRQDALLYLSDDISLENWNQHVLKMLQQIQTNGSFYHTTVKFDQNILTGCFSEMTNKLFHELFERLDEHNQVCLKDREFYSRFFSYGCSGVLLKWIFDEYTESAEEIAKQMVRLAKDTQFLVSQL
ncbi:MULTISPECIES: TetR/AcrR family transcriptional regulator C-terminal domain-containing protein [Bacillus]|uniref:TetR/AcrR family transcriptional regulator C-terminal domain-containing protein n=1 Tax=Bacillus TaxID=1386 RepID=UPI0002EEF300|nr:MULTISPECIES: TetR/AcrR family transcriptional regulator C-terminal domain-containing protein [Bacillus]